jgi:hypothetical protein
VTLKIVLNIFEVGHIFKFNFFEFIIIFLQRRMLTGISVLSLSQKFSKVLFFYEPAAFSDIRRMIAFGP